LWGSDWAIVETGAHVDSVLMIAAATEAPCMLRIIGTGSGGMERDFLDQGSSTLSLGFIS
jgi:hypothetical protein